MSKNNTHRAPQSSQETKVSAPKKKAVGLEAVQKSIQQMGRYMDMPKALKASLKMNQKGGFDCPGCAWPDPEDERSSIGEYCENGIKALVEEATKNRANPSFFEKHSVQDLAALSDFELGKSGRITHPMYLAKGASHYRPIEWKQAYALINQHLKSCDSPDEAVFYTSGRTSNEAAFLYGAFVRAFGTNNLPDCSNMCHESSGSALSNTVGIGKGSVKLEDLHQADLIIILGQNPGTNHPRMLNALEKNKMNGGKIVVVNPLKEAGLMHYTNPQKPFKILSGGVSLADEYVQVKVNGDMGFLKAILYKLHQLEKKGEDIYDKDFIKEYTEGFEAYSDQIGQIDYEKCLIESGITDEQIDRVVHLIQQNKKIIACWAMGLTQHKNGVATIQEVVNLLLLKGSIGKPGAGTCPVRGHSNVQGDRTMGIWEKMPEAYHQRLSKAFNIDSPRHHGYDTVESIKAMYENKVKVFFAMGGNFLSAAPDTDITAQGLQNCDLTVHVSTKPNRSHLVHGSEALILPCRGRTEIDEQKSGYQFVSVENSMGQVHSSKGVLPPISEHLKSEINIVCEMADEVLGTSDMDWLQFGDDYDKIRDKIEEVIPGFDQYNQRIRTDTGFYLPNPARDRSFTKTGKAKFTVNALTDNQLESHQYTLMTLRSHDQYNTTIYGLDDRYRGIKNGRKIIFMNMSDMQKQGLGELDLVHVHSYFQGEKRSIYSFKVVPYDIPSGCLAAYFPEANPLVAINNVADISNTPASKRIIVEIEKI